jgi:hypothetical protein
MENRLRQMLGLPPLTEEEERNYREERERREQKHRERRRIIAEGRTCAKCGGRLGDAVYRYKPLLDGGGYVATTYRRMPTHNVDPICEECAPNWLPELQTRVYKLYMHSHKAPCETCGREVYFVSANKDEATTRVFCCDDCRDRAPKSRVVGPHEKVCEVCGEAFEARRSDAKTCSPACRQRAYRQRSEARASKRYA